jgi:hypothetical protein
MGLETALVFSDTGETLFWHVPLERSEYSLPDSRTLWEVLWENRALLGGVAHTHPWEGPAWPSQTDVTTWRALEKGLGKLLLWPIVTFSDVKYFGWNPITEQYCEMNLEKSTIILDVEKLRELSRSSDSPVE